MSSEPGQDPGHPPGGLAWGELVDAWRERAGGWTALAEELVRRGGAAELPSDLATIEKGLRRLAARGHRPGGQYGRWMGRLFGVPAPVADYLRWLGQYHSRFSDLPVSLRRRQLAVWDRPPVSETADGVWVDFGMASVAWRERDRAGVDARLARAAPRARRASVAAALELSLFEARLASEDGDADAVEAHLERARERLDDPSLGPDDRACYRARVLDAEAYRAARADGVEAARAFYAAIDDASGVPFVAFRRALGLAYCAWKVDDAAGGLALARAAAEHAADGGFVRLRAMALNLASRIADGDEAAALRAHAERLSARLEDEDLLARVHKP